MTIEIPQELLDKGSTQELLVELACLLYDKANMSLPRCARMVGMTRDDFQRELWTRKIAMQYDVADLEEDMKNYEQYKDARSK